MTWEETIKFIRTQPEYKDLVELAYFEENLPLNVERFMKSEEYSETKKLIKQYSSFDRSIKLLDIGSGNGISSVSFALEGISVDSVEPDPSETIGAGAIKKLKEHYKISNLNVHEGFAEDLKFPTEHYDIVYIRQCMHHAYDLNQFIKECARVLKPGGLLITVRDHVIYSEKDKQWFLESHPLQKFYGGENAFSLAEYSSSMVKAGLEIKQILKHFDSPINYFPLKSSEKKAAELKSENFVLSLVQKKIGALQKIGFVKKVVANYIKHKVGDVYNESQVPGRMYTFIAIKK